VLHGAITFLDTFVVSRKKQIKQPKVLFACAPLTNPMELHWNHIQPFSLVVLQKYLDNNYTSIVYSVMDIHRNKRQNPLK
jgi:hypothetical protein